MLERVWARAGSVHFLCFHSLPPVPQILVGCATQYGETKPSLLEQRRDSHHSDRDLENTSGLRY